jgi:hypothetical protein
MSPKVHQAIAEMAKALGESATVPDSPTVPAAPSPAWPKTFEHRPLPRYILDEVGDRVPTSSRYIRRQRHVEVTDERESEPVAEDPVLAVDPP